MTGVVRDAAAVLDDLLALLPTGWSWPRHRDSNVARTLQPLAAEIARLEAAMCDLIAHADPRNAVHLLADYERVLGPDPCGQEAQGLDSVQRRMNAHRRWLGIGGQSPAFFVALAAAAGVKIRIEETRAIFVAGRARAGLRLRNNNQRFVWRVRLPAVQVQKFRAGRSRAAQHLGAFRPSRIECVIRHHAPAQTIPVFSYEGT